MLESADKALESADKAALEKLEEARRALKAELEQAEKAAAEKLETVQRDLDACSLRGHPEA
jgi:vacuolar-type H+-ATPase subunit E/Vma4